MYIAKGYEKVTCTNNVHLKRWAILEHVPAFRTSSLNGSVEMVNSISFLPKQTPNVTFPPE